jgi:guanylate kinase
MVIICGASASGKTELSKLMRQTYGYQKMITCTTRPPRDFEMDGVDYHFLSEEWFNVLKNDGAFIETTQYQTNQYGTRIQDIHVNAILIVDPPGANVFFTQRPHQDMIVLIQSPKDLRRGRMLRREKDVSEIGRRLETDDAIFDPKQFHHLDLILKNDNQPMAELAETLHLAYQMFLEDSHAL